MTASSALQLSARALGIVYTPQDIANAIVREVESLQPTPFKAVLEPSVGDGAFLGALEKFVPIDRIVALDIDEQAIARVRCRFGGATVEVREFLGYAASASAKSFDLVIGNPPYIRRNNFGSQISSLIDELATEQDYPRAQIKNAWAAFIVAAEPLLTDDGVLAFVVPYELINVDYGIAILRWLTAKFDRTDVYVPDEKAFRHIDQDAVLVVARKHATEKGAFIRRVPSLEKLQSVPRRIELEDQTRISTSLKGFLLDPAILDKVNGILANSRRIKDYCQNGAGIVTAANNFFILTDEEVRHHDLTSWALPILKKSTYLGIGPVFTQSDFSRLQATVPCNLIDLTNYNPALPDASVEAFLERGRISNVPESYKARHRPAWFKVPITWLGEGFFFKRSHAYPRICVNEANVHVTDTAYSVKPIGEATMRGICYSFYNSLTLLMSEIEGRFYGGGVLELTPSEFRRLPIYYTEPTDAEFAAFCRAEIWSDPSALARRGDLVLLEKHRFKKRELEVFHKAWQILRLHRLRHGRSS
jgi:adenine-specific DNA-methyltransferase